jgi:hypothetical protein
MTGWDLPTVSCIAARCSALAAAGGINLPTPGRQIGPGRSDAQQPISAALQRNSARACHPGLVGFGADHDARIRSGQGRRQLAAFQRQSRVKGGISPLAGRLGGQAAV